MTMKHILMLCLAAWLGTASLTAQEVVADTVATGMEEGVLTHDIKGVVTDKDGQPVVGALVTLRDYEDKPRLFKKYEEYGISAITDVDGKFFLEDVSVTAKYIVVESVGMGTEVREINKPLSVDTKRKKLTFVVQAGVSMSRYTVNGGSFKTGYEVGVRAGGAHLQALGFPSYDTAGPTGYGLRTESRRNELPGNLESEFPGFVFVFCQPSEAGS